MSSPSARWEKGQVIVFDESNHNGVYNRVYDGNANLCFDGSGTDDDLEKARVYWEKSQSDENPVIETLFDDVITVEELIDAEEIL